MNRNVAYETGDCEVLKLYAMLQDWEKFFKKKTVSKCTDTTTNTQYGHAAV